VSDNFDNIDPTFEFTENKLNRRRFYDLEVPRVNHFYGPDKIINWAKNKLHNVKGI